VSQFQQVSHPAIGLAANQHISFWLDRFLQLVSLKLYMASTHSLARFSAIVFCFISETYVVVVDAHEMIVKRPVDTIRRTISTSTKVNQDFLIRVFLI
jgi:hypothetical protein